MRIPPPHGLSSSILIIYKNHDHVLQISFNWVLNNKMQFTGLPQNYAFVWTHAYKICIPNISTEKK